MSSTASRFSSRSTPAYRSVISSEQCPTCDRSTMRSTPAASINVLNVRRRTWQPTLCSMPSSAATFCIASVSADGSRYVPVREGNTSGFFGVRGSALTST